MRILLIKTEFISPVDLDLCSPLGILCIAAVAERAGHDIDLFDMRPYRSILKMKSDLDHLIARRPDVVGLSATTPYAQSFEIIARYIKKKLPEAFRIGGGPYASTEYTEILQSDLVDVCVLGEGEAITEQLLQTISTNESYTQIPGIAWIHDGKVQVNQSMPFIEDLDSLPIPAWHLLDIPLYKGHLGMSSSSRESFSIFTSRGCPYQCIFCHDFFGKKYRARSAENVLSEIDLLYNEYGIRNLEIIDDFFNCQRDRTIKILEGIRDRYPDVGIAFPNGLRTDILDEQIIRLMKEAHCYHVSVAVETASERIQKSIKKNINFKKLTENLHLLKKYNIFRRGFFMIGFPDETLEEIYSTVRFAIDNPFNYSLIFIVSPFNENELRNQIDPDRLKNILGKKGVFDYQFGNYSISDIPYDTLANIQHKYWTKSLLRLRNLPFFLTTLKAAILHPIRSVLVEHMLLYVASLFKRGRVSPKNFGLKRKRQILHQISEKFR